MSGLAVPVDREGAGDSGYGLIHLRRDDYRRVGRRDQSGLDCIRDFLRDLRRDGSDSGGIRPTHRVRRCETCLKSVPGAGLRTDGGQTAVIVHEVDAELGVVQVLGEIAQREPSLAGVARDAVRAAEHAGKVGIERRLCALR